MKSSVLYQQACQPVLSLGVPCQEHLHRKNPGFTFASFVRAEHTRKQKVRLQSPSSIYLHLWESTTPWEFIHRSQQVMHSTGWGFKKAIRCKQPSAIYNSTKGRSVLAFSMHLLNFIILHYSRLRIEGGFFLMSFHGSCTPKHNPECFML